MSELTVCAVMLVNGRAEMVRRACVSYLAQAYPNKSLLVLDTGTPRQHITVPNVYTATYPEWAGKTIGELRNLANERVRADVIAHWDSDDWFDPRRLEEQVALLQSTGKACVGYRELLFWDTRRDAGESWVYRHPDPRWCAGASFLYRRRFWVARPFDDAPHEDQRWWMQHAEQFVGCSSLIQGGPRMIAHIHGANTETIPRKVLQASGGGVWRRAPEWDEYCAERMALT